MSDTVTQRPRGFAALTPERRAEISRMGGKAGAGSPNRPWARDTDLASRAGKIGGSVPKKPLTPAE